MGLKQGDLNDTVLSKVSIDEFEPKTGESKDVLVLGFHVLEQNVGDDLYSFLNSSVFEIRDVEGRLIFEDVGAPSKQVDVSHLLSGIYFIDIVTVLGRTSERFVKK